MINREQWINNLTHRIGNQLRDNLQEPVIPCFPDGEIEMIESSILIINKDLNHDIRRLKEVVNSDNRLSSR